MRRWKALPAALDPSARELVLQLRQLKDARELSLAQVAAKTGYSASSWERYLAGRNLPPRQAVEAFARAYGADPDRLLALHEVATVTWAGAAVPERRAAAPPDTPADPPAPQPAPERPRRGRRIRIAVVAGVLVMSATAVLLAVRPWHDSGSAAPPSYVCRITRTDGLWYAGLSRTRTDLVQQGMAGAEVAEVQCLLKRAGFPPGDVDGIYGDLTQRAVRRLQTKHHLAVDGVVGPHTWKALRG
ncbi:peptidoglycan-binding protein [Streptomyces sp. NBC_01176]|uniref:peptidoglycan-binding protein n=1 Tax=Streptomyces sp. NBC_01176 TaxID=2903760 RepID=UPI003870EB0F|nr:helix-turn-helix domain-containing protein [Streptomyces sp. NBC_01176]